MLKYEDARKKVVESIGDGFIVDDQATIDRGYGWIFFYIRDKAYGVEADLPIIGGVTYLVRKDTGEIVLFPSWKPYEDSLKDYEQKMGLSRPE